jgi:putative spermidine/putrescine transport system permease protein
MFACLASADSYPVSIFLTDAWTKPLPIQMLQYLEESSDPSVAAISSGLILLAVLSLFVGDRVASLRRLADH